MEIEESRQGAVVVITPMGPMVSDDADVFAQRASNSANESLGRVVVDASQMPYVDSRGLEVLLDLASQLTGMGRSLKLIGINDTIREVFDLTDITDMFEFFADATSAIRSFV